MLSDTERESGIPPSPLHVEGESGLGWRDLVSGGCSRVSLGCGMTQFLNFREKLLTHGSSRVLFLHPRKGYRGLENGRRLRRLVTSFPG